VISKQPLELNFARNAAESDCPVWSGIRKVIETLVIRELATARHLTDSQRQYLGIRLRNLAACVPGAAARAAHARRGTFVVTDVLLDRFGTDSLRHRLALLSETGPPSRGYPVGSTHAATPAPEAETSVVENRSESSVSFRIGDGIPP